MGNLLETPVTEKVTHRLVVPSTDNANTISGGGSSSGGAVSSASSSSSSSLSSSSSSSSSRHEPLGALEVAVSGMQGFRPEMEDAHIACFLKSAPDHILLAVFDGHGGSGAAKYAAANLEKVIERLDEWNRGYLQDKSIDWLGEVMKKAFVKLDEDMRKVVETTKPSNFGGCTAVSAIITPTYIVCANAGDSRCVLSSGHRVIPLSEDHKPQNQSEKYRIEMAGGMVQGNRIDGSLAVSRGLGDFEFKDRKHLSHDMQKVSCVPDIKLHERVRTADDCLMLACDGVWDVFSNEEALDNVKQIWLEGEKNIELVAEEILDMALDRGSEDNISVIVARLDAALISETSIGGVISRRKLREDKLPKSYGGVNIDSNDDI